MSTTTNTRREDAGGNNMVNGNGLWRTIERAALVFTLVVTLSNLGVLLWKGGMLSNTVDTHGVRIDKLERQGSDAVRELAAEGRAKSEALDKRVERLENLSLSQGASMGAINTKLGIIETGVSNIKDALNEHKAQTERLMNK